MVVEDIFMVTFFCLTFLVGDDTHFILKLKNLDFKLKKAQLHIKNIEFQIQILLIRKHIVLVYK